ncbi:7-deoxyloganetin glucosyltransferase-like [Oryza glaberrima]|uniref:Glycosyltransferase n=1 Tax=Oryza glaberrima TaxID=4538 RepID=I1PK59_ORYGL|nr:7-deoxyloganetin glucosyltransferase-like [Oryza glaberrima]
MASAMGVPGDKPPHAVCVPYPSQGDITPTLHLAKLLHARGFHVTFVNTEFNHRRLLASRGAAALDGVPGFVFAAIPDGLPAMPGEDEDATQDIPALCQSTMTNCLGHLLALLARLNEPASGSPPVTCLVADGLMSFAYDAAREIGVPCAALWTASACGFVGCRLYRELIDRGLVPLRDASQLTDGYLDTVVDGAAARGMCDGVQLRDYPSFIRTTDLGDVMLNFIMREAERLSLPDAVILNTFDDFERPALDAMRAILPPVYTVGPLHLHVRHVVPKGSPLDTAIGSNLWKEQDGVLEWLDGHPRNSVVYVSYGSIAVMTSEQLLEFAWGLADSGYAFVWVVRPDLVKRGDADAAALPPEFYAAVQGRGVLPTWCSQEKVLEHDAVGVFLTHSGWNSTLESLSAGVPMLSWPFFAEQQTNCRYKRTEWGVGMEIGGEARRGEVAAMIREAMEGKKGREMRRRAQEWKEKAVRVTLPGGPGDTNLDRVIHEVLLSCKDKISRVNGDSV